MSFNSDLIISRGKNKDKKITKNDIATANLYSYSLSDFIADYGIGQDRLVPWLRRNKLYITGAPVADNMNQAQLMKLVEEFDFNLTKVANALSIGIDMLRIRLKDYGLDIKNKVIKPSVTISEKDLKYYLNNHLSLAQIAEIANTYVECLAQQCEKYNIPFNRNPSHSSSASLITVRPIDIQNYKNAGHTRAETYTHFKSIDNKLTEYYFNMIMDNPQEFTKRKHFQKLQTEALTILRSDFKDKENKDIPWIIPVPEVTNIVYSGPEPTVKPTEILYDYKPTIVNKSFKSNYLNTTAKTVTSKYHKKYNVLPNKELTWDNIANGITESKVTESKTTESKTIESKSTESKPTNIPVPTVKVEKTDTIPNVKVCSLPKIRKFDLKIMLKSIPLNRIAKYLNYTEEDLNRLCNKYHLNEDPELEILNLMDILNDNFLDLIKRTQNISHYRDIAKLLNVWPGYVRLALYQKKK